MTSSQRPNMSAALLLEIVARGVGTVWIRDGNALVAAMTRSRLQTESTLQKQPTRRSDTLTMKAASRLAYRQG
jgi:hypothetical protein